MEFGIRLSALDRVFKVKRIYSVSYKTVLLRLINLGAADNNVWKKFNLAYQRRFNRKLSFKEEPRAIPSAEPYGLKRLISMKADLADWFAELWKKNKYPLAGGRRS